MLRVLPEGREPFPTSSGISLVLNAIFCEGVTDIRQVTIVSGGRSFLIR
jgi:hypothetical protein